jgi:hypothetical protein
MSASAAIADPLLRRAGSPLEPSTYCTSMPRVLTAPRAGLTTRLSDFATNRHEECGLIGQTIWASKDCSRSSTSSATVQLKLILNPADGLFPQGARQAGMVVKKPRAERGDTFSIFCGYQRILPGGSNKSFQFARSIRVNHFIPSCTS